jgi:hypothetical protein
VAAVLLAAGCGGSGDGEAVKPTPTPADPPNLLTAADVERESADQSDPAAAREVLGFWRDVQYQNFPRAYPRLSRELRGTVSYARFVQVFANAVPLFLYRLRVQSTEVEGSTATVYTLIQTQGRATPADPPIAFNLVRESGRWRLSTDPRNVLGTRVGSSSTE